MRIKNVSLADFGVEEADWFTEKLKGEFNLKTKLQVDLKDNSLHRDVLKMLRVSLKGSGIEKELKVL